MVMVGLLLRNLLMPLWCFSDCNVCGCGGPFDVAAAVVVRPVNIVVVLLQAH